MPYLTCCAAAVPESAPYPLWPTWCVRRRRSGQTPEQYLEEALVDIERAIFTGKADEPRVRMLLAKLEWLIRSSVEEDRGSASDRIDDEWQSIGSSPAVKGAEMRTLQGVVGAEWAVLLRTGAECTRRPGAGRSQSSSTELLHCRCTFLRRPGATDVLERIINGFKPVTAML